MARGRKTETQEIARECVEGSMSALGNARVYGHMVRDRMAASRAGRQADLVDALDDLQQMDRLIVLAQNFLKKILEGIV